MELVVLAVVEILLRLSEVLEGVVALLLEFFDLGLTFFAQNGEVLSQLEELLVCQFCQVDPTRPDRLHIEDLIGRRP